VKARKTPAAAKLEVDLPFEATNWRSVWLDHFSFRATNYKASVSYYVNLLGWGTTYDEGSQNEVLMGDVGDALVRGGNPNDPNFGKAPANGKAQPANIRIDHISFGIQLFDPDAVKEGLEKRGWWEAYWKRPTEKLRSRLWDARPCLVSRWISSSWMCRCRNWTASR
jgi:hypothetical protein